MDVKQEIEQLRAALNEAGYEYYVLDRPTMSDYDYDHRLRRLEELEIPGVYHTGFSHPAGGRRGGLRI